MKLRHLVTITFLSVAFLLSAGHIPANYEGDQIRPIVATERAPTPEDAARFEQLANLLRQSETGRDMLALKETYQVAVRFEAGGGSSFGSASNRILLESNLEPVDAALVFVHEMHHARTLHEGTKANRETDSRQAYINQMIWEETEGMLVSIRVKTELETNGVIVTDLTLPYEEEYRWAYQNAVELARATSPGLSDQGLDAIGMTAGRQALFDTHMRGEPITATTHEIYLDYYGRLWDEAHPIWAYVLSNY